MIQYLRWELLDAVSTPNLESVARCLTIYLYEALQRLPQGYFAYCL